MKRTVVLNAIHLGPGTFEPLPGTVPEDAGLCSGETAFDRALAFARRVAGRQEGRVVLLTDPVTARRVGPWVSDGAAGADPAPVQMVREGWTVGDLVDSLAETGSDSEIIVYAHADEPFLDADLAESMIADHRRYYAEYSFSEGRPSGIAPQILSGSTPAGMAGILADRSEPVDRNSIFSVIERDINRFDIETEIAPRDRALWRIQLNTGTARDALLCRRVAAFDPKSAEHLVDIIDAAPEILRTLPAYVQVQLTGGCPQACSYCAFPIFGGSILQNRDEMPLERFESLLDAVAEFSPGTTIGVSVWGEPALHSRAEELLRAVAARPALSLLVETSGVGWRPEVLESLCATPLTRTTWILSLDAVDEKLYREIRGEGFAEAVSTTQRLLSAYPKTTYVQAVRLDGFEESYRSFWEQWKSRTPNVIIQKYDHVSHFLPERKPADMSPLDRLPCVHNKRDLVVLLDGTVPLCKEDVRRERVLGNVFEEPLAAVWDRGQACHLEQTRGEYRGICAACDEYYTYNF